MHSNSFKPRKTNKSPSGMASKLLTNAVGSNMSTMILLTVSSAFMLSTTITVTVFNVLNTINHFHFTANTAARLRDDLQGQ